MNSEVIVMMKKSNFPVQSLTIAGVPVSEFVIIPGAGGHTTEAAYMLAEYLEKACGAFVPVREMPAAIMPYEILIGKTDRDIPAVADRRNALKNDGVLFYVAPNKKLYLDSDSTLGVRFAVSKFLEQYVGVRFYDEQTERILPADAIDIPANLDYSHSSPLLYRHTDWSVETPLRRKWGLNGEDGVENRIIGFCHTMERLTGVPQNQQPCLSDENVYQKVLAGVRQWIKENPGCRIISVTQNDNCNYCRCPKCEALAKKENQSGVMLTFVNRLADEIKDEYPDVNLLTFAYQYTRKPPVTIKPRDNVIMWLCSIECCFSHPLDDPKCKLNAAFHEDIVKWSSIAKKVYVWDYITDYNHYCMPFANFHTLLPNTKFFVDNHVVAIYEEGGYQQKVNGEFRALRAYLTAQMLWDPAMTQDKWDALIKDFLEGYYGRGWKYIYQYITQTCARATKRHMRIYLHGRDILAKSPKVQIDEAFCLRMQGLWNKACALAQTAREKKHCAESRLQIDLLTLSAHRVATNEIDVAGNKAVIAGLKREGALLIHEGNHVPGLLIRSLDDETAEKCSPDEWDVLNNPDFRKKFGLKALEDIKDDR